MNEWYGSGFVGWSDVLARERARNTDDDTFGGYWNTQHQHRLVVGAALNTCLLHACCIRGWGLLIEKHMDVCMYALRDRCVKRSILHVRSQKYDTCIKLINSNLFLHESDETRI